VSDTNSPRSIDVISRSFARMLSGEVAEKLRRFHMRHCFEEYGCLLHYDDQGPRGEDPPIISYAPFVRSRIYAGTRESGSYNHHSQLVKFKGRYFFGFSNGRRDELTGGQRLMLASSDDGKDWTAPTCVVGGEEDSPVSHTIVGLRATEDTLYLLDRYDETTHDPAAVGMRRVETNNTRVDVYASSDGEQWDKVFALAEPICRIFEAPRETADGRLLCVASLRDGAAILRWPGNELLERPEIVPVPEPHGASFPYGEGSWYQTDDGTVVVFWRDEGQSCRLWVNTSTDGGSTFSEPAISDIPDSMSRVYAGRLPDGRCYLCNNAFPALLDRLHLMLLLSDDGYTFDQVYLLIDDPTSQRVAGLLKADGYQYPCCLPDGDRLLVGYSVNKEDIECGIIDLQEIRSPS